MRRNDQVTYNLIRNVDDQSLLRYFDDADAPPMQIPLFSKMAQNTTALEKRYVAGSILVAQIAGYSSPVEEIDNQETQEN